jgi:hypothetical protein
MVTVACKAKYRPPGNNLAKKCGINGDHNNRARKKHRFPAPVSRQRVMVLSPDMKIRWEG